MTSFTFPFRFLLEMHANQNLVIQYEQFVDKFCTPKNPKLARICSLKFVLKKPYLNTHFLVLRTAVLALTLFGTSDPG